MLLGNAEPRNVRTLFLALVSWTLIWGLIDAADAADITHFEHPPSAPGFDLPDISGTQWSLDDFGGQLLVVNFWATWCAPCVRELPDLAQLHKSTNGAEVTVVAIAMRQLAVDIEEFLDARPEMRDLGFPLIPDRDGQTTAAWDVSSLPTSFILDGDGRIHYKIVGDPGWTSPELHQKLEKVAEP